jgi:hypothetical protein
MHVRKQRKHRLAFSMIGLYSLERRAMAQNIAVRISYRICDALA